MRIYRRNKFRKKKKKKPRKGDELRVCSVGQFRRRCSLRVRSLREQGATDEEKPKKSGGRSARRGSHVFPVRAPDGHVSPRSTNRLAAVRGRAETTLRYQHGSTPREFVRRINRVPQTPPPSSLPGKLATKRNARNYPRRFVSVSKRRKKKGFELLNLKMRLLSWRFHGFHRNITLFKHSRSLFFFFVLLGLFNCNTTR